MKKIIVATFTLLFLLILTSCIISKTHNFQIVEGNYILDSNESKEIEIIENQTFKIDNIVINLIEITKNEFDELQGINTIMDLSKSETARTYFKIKITVIGDDVNTVLNVKNVSKFANAKEMYRMDFESSLGDGAIEFYIYEFHVGIGFHPTYQIFKLNKENVE